MSSPVITSKGCNVSHHTAEYEYSIKAAAVTLCHLVTCLLTAGCTTWTATATSTPWASLRPELQVPGPVCATFPAHTSVSVQGPNPLKPGTTYEI